MRKSELKRFKRIFEEQKRALLYNDRVLRDDFNVNDDDRYDEVDQAASDTEQSMRMRLRNRERLYLRKVEEALSRIEDGVFGDCDECGEPIEKRRLEVRPTAELCIACKEDEEKMELMNASGIKPKSLGEAFSRSYAY